MRSPQIVVYENPGSPASQLEKLTREGDWTAAQLLEALARGRGWLLREARQRPACVRLVRSSPACVLVVKLERKLIDEMALVSAVHAHAPDAPIVVVNAVKLDGEQRAGLTALAYDLGATCVLSPPYTQAVLEQVVARVMESLLSRG